MATNTTPSYIESQTLETYKQSQESVYPDYSTDNYLGSSMRVMEEQSENFLETYVNGMTLVKPEDNQLLEEYFEVLSYSKYAPIRHLLKKAKKKYQESLAQQSEQPVAQPIPVVTPTRTASPMPHVIPQRPVVSQPTVTAQHSANPQNKYIILENKKKMHALSSTQMYELGQQLDQETAFSTTKLKNKFTSFVAHHASQVLSGKKPMDDGFDALVTTYAPMNYRARYMNKRKTVSQTVASDKPISQPKPVSDEKPAPKQKKKGGFFSKIKKVFSAVTETVYELSEGFKRPLLIGGVFVLTIFGGKKIAEEIDKLDNQDLYYSHATYSKPTDKAAESDTLKSITELWDTQTAQPQPDASAAKTQHSTTHQAKSGTTVSNTKTYSQTNAKTDVMQKTIRKLNQLKQHNPTDRNMDVDKTAENLYKTFGADTYDVVLASAMAPFALNDSTHLDIRPSTHNMIEYFSTHELTANQRAAVKNFITTHVKNGKINMDNFKRYNVTNLKQLRDLKAQNQR